MILTQPRTIELCRYAFWLSILANVLHVIRATGVPEALIP